MEEVTIKLYDKSKNIKRFSCSNDTAVSLYNRLMKQEKNIYINGEELRLKDLEHILIEDIFINNKYQSIALQLI